MSDEVYAEKEGWVRKESSEEDVRLPARRTIVGFLVYLRCGERVFGGVGLYQAQARLLERLAIVRIVLFTMMRLAIY